MDCRSSLAFPTLSGSSILCLRAPVAGLLLPPYFSTSFGLPIPQGCARFLVGFQNLRSFRLSALPAFAFRTLDFSAAEAASLSVIVRSLNFPDLFDLHQRELFPVCRPAEACTSWRLSQGIASPFRVTLLWYDRLLQSPAWVTYSVPCEYLTVFRYPPYCLPAGRPSGWWVSSNGILKLLLRTCAVNMISS